MDGRVMIQEFTFDPMAKEQRMSIDWYANNNETVEQFRLTREPANPTGEERRDRGMELAAERRAGALAKAQSFAKHLATQEQKTVTASDVRQAMESAWAAGYGQYTWEDLGNAAGSIFRGKQWRHTGRYEKASHEHSHARRVGVWEWVG